MYAWYKCHYLIGAGTEAELLIDLLTSRAILLQCSPDPLNNVQGLGSQIMVLLEKAALYLCCQGSCVLLYTKGVLRVSIDCYDAAWTGHLELDISIVWYHVESCKHGSSEQCVVAAAEGDNIEE